MLFFRLVRCMVAFLVVTGSVIGLMTFLASPPMHLFYSVAPTVGRSSVYVPGSGFSGFWFHLGALQAIPDLTSYNYYCFSSGCLSTLMAATNTSIDDAVEVAFGIQRGWVSGNLTRFDLVQHFVESILNQTDHDAIRAVLPNMNILVTSKSKGVEILQSTDLEDLKDALIKTTWIPYVTGNGVLAEEDEIYLDGGFSRMLHPKCEFDLHVPQTLVNYLYTLHPGMSRSDVEFMWESGTQFDHPLLDRVSS